MTVHTQFACPTCGQALHLRNNYFRVLILFAIIVAGLLSYAVGVRGDALLPVVFIAMWPMEFVLLFITLRLFPPDVEATGDFRSILYGPSRLRETAAPAADDVDTAAEQQASIDSAVAPPHRIFTVGDERRSFEGVVLRGALILLTLAMAWIAGKPLVHRLVPELGATKKGPAAFPMKIHIGDQAIAFTNESTETWSCEAELGFSRAHAFAFTLEPQQTRELSYVNFRGAETEMETDDLRAAAHGKVSISCAEPSGRMHFWQFR